MLNSTFSYITTSLICLANVAVGVSAFLTLLHIRRHWRDDEPKITVTIEENGSTERRNGKVISWAGFIRIANTGKVPVTIIGIELAEDVAQKRFRLGTAGDIDHFLEQGTSFKCCASLMAKEKGVPIPERFTIRCKWTEAQKRNGHVVIDLGDLAATSENGQNLH